MSSSKRGSKESKNELLPEKQMYTTWGDMLRHWPKTTLCIVSNEFCERFSYYGMRTVLVLYLLNVLKFTEDQSNIFFNVFTILCYLTPMLGSIIADGFIGKFWTILTVSVVYAAGQVLLAVASTKGYMSSVHPAMDFAGLAIIALGTGGIKPCVSAFGGDQFELGQERMLSLYFSVFYFSINAGSMISTFISPIFRTMPCMGQDSCYPLAFGIPAILMIVATLIFASGSFWYKKVPPKENIFAEVTYIFWGALRNKCKKGSVSTPHWLDHYMDNHICENDEKCLALREETGRRKACQKKIYVEDIKNLLRLLVMFLPVPMFWALYNQQASTWLFQGIEMNSRCGSVMVLPDQMQTLNAVLILAFIPLFQAVVYPICQYFFDFTPLRRMVAGGLLASLAFCITGFLQLAVNSTLPILPSGGEAFVSVWNQLDGYNNCSITAIGPDGNFTVFPGSALLDKKDSDDQTFHFKVGLDDAFIGSITLDYDVAKCPKLPKTYQTIPMKEKKYYYIGVTNLGLYMREVDPSKPTDGSGEFSIGFTTLTNTGYSQNLALCREGKFADGDEHPCDPKSPNDFYWWEINYDFNAKNNKSSDDRDSFPAITAADNNGKNYNLSTVGTAYTFKPVKPGKWRLYYLFDQSPKDVNQQTQGREYLNATDTGIAFEVEEQGGVYVITLTGEVKTPNMHKFQFVGSNTVNILWQIPQIIVITAAEILFSITGYEFAYSQSAVSMKALVQALWLLTTAAGSAIIVLITVLDLFSDQAVEFFAYAGIMAATILVFALLSIFYYDYNYYTSDTQPVYDDDDDEEKPHSVEDDSSSLGNLRKRSLDPSCIDLKF